MARVGLSVQWKQFLIVIVSSAMAKSKLTSLLKICSLVADCSVEMGKLKPI